MANTTFTDGVTLTDDEWFNHVNDAVYEVMGDGTTPPSTAVAAMKNLFKRGADIASASTVNLAAATGNYVHITGTVTITSLGTVNSGVPFWLVFDGALTLTHNATSLILPGAANITTVAGDSLFAVSEGSGNWKVISYTRASTLIPSFPGEIKAIAFSSVPNGWLACDGSLVSRTTYSNLFAAVSTTWGAGDGSTTFGLPNLNGRSIVGSGTGTAGDGGSDAQVDTGANTLTVPTNTDKWITGMLVTFTLTSGTVTGLTSGNPYYVIRSSSTLIQLASTLALAQNGTAIDFTAKATPVWTIAHALTARTLGEYIGEEKHAISVTEDLAHTHTQTAHSHVQRSSANTDLVIDSGGGTNSVMALTVDVNSGNAPNTTADTTAVNASTGGNVAQNNMSPAAVVKYIISY